MEKTEQKLQRFQLGLAEGKKEEGTKTRRLLLGQSKKGKKEPKRNMKREKKKFTTNKYKKKTEKTLKHKKEEVSANGESKKNKAEDNGESKKSKAKAKETEDGEEDKEYAVLDNHTTSKHQAREISLTSRNPSTGIHNIPSKPP